ncbi:MAG: hypothetical protein KDE58_25095, partial [Caldilineaceae bacterium]|nr:hypothetical protein [Caldilineaceae bacterium]
MNRMTYYLSGILLSILCLSTACMPLQPISAGAMDGTIPVMNDLVRDITVAGKPEHFTTPLDATPNANGSLIYFTALNSTGNGLFSVSAEGGEVTDVLVGTPLVEPGGVDISSDDATLYVADSGADQLFAIHMADGVVQAVAGSIGTQPLGVEVVAEADG